MEYIQSLIMAFSISFPNYLYTKLEELQHIYNFKRFIRKFVSTFENNLELCFHLIYSGIL